MVGSLIGASVCELEGVVIALCPQPSKFYGNSVTCRGLFGSSGGAGERLDCHQWAYLKGVA